MVPSAELEIGNWETELPSLAAREARAVRTFAFVALSSRAPWFRDGGYLQARSEVRSVRASRTTALAGTRFPIPDSQPPLLTSVP